MRSAWVAREPWLSQPPLLFEENMHTRVTSETLPLCSCQSCAALGTRARLTSAYSISVDGCQRGRVCAPMTGCKTGWRTSDLCGTAALSLDSLNLQKLELCEPPRSGSSWLKSSYLRQCDYIMSFVPVYLNLLTTITEVMGSSERRARWF